MNYLDQLENNKNFNGGGLATNITGKFESNRHAIARAKKYTFGEVCAELKKKKNGGLKISATELLEIYRANFGEPEWHHAGKLPKQYGGGMKKTHFLDEIPIVEEVREWKEKYRMVCAERKRALENETKRTERRLKFAQKNGEWFERKSEIPRFASVEKTEMNGKYGWFEVERHHSYNLTEYYSGWKFKSQKSLDKFNQF